MKKQPTNFAETFRRAARESRLARAEQNEAAAMGLTVDEYRRAKVAAENDVLWLQTMMRGGAR
jgi:hypothetical protein